MSVTRFYILDCHVIETLYYFPTRKLFLSMQTWCMSRCIHCTLLLILLSPKNHIPIRFLGKDGLMVELPLPIDSVTEEITTSKQSHPTTVHYDSCTRDMRSILSCSHGNMSGNVHSLSSNAQNNDNSHNFSLDYTSANSISPSESNFEISDNPHLGRKQKDMMRKRLLRQSVEYRNKETTRSRHRMKLKRCDPEYRERERMRDRERRRQARSSAPEKRAMERERDRQYRKRVRDDSKKMDMVVSTVSTEVIVMTEEMDVNSKLHLSNSNLV